MGGGCGHPVGGGGLGGLAVGGGGGVPKGNIVIMLLLIWSFNHAVYIYETVYY